MRNLQIVSILVCSMFLSLSGCQTAPKSESDRDELKMSATDAMRQMEAEDASLRSFVDNGYGYVIFPKVGKGAWIIGGSYGRGIVYKQGTHIGYADISQATIGLQAGGQTTMELLVFETAKDLDRFTSGKLSFAANLSAVILKSGAAASAKYTDGVAVFVKPIGGAMVEASVGGQQFTYLPE